MPLILPQLEGYHAEHFLGFRRLTANQPVLSIGKDGFSCYLPNVEAQPRGGCAQAVFRDEKAPSNGSAPSRIEGPVPALRCSDWFGHWEQSITAVMNSAILPWRISGIFSRASSGIKALVHAEARRSRSNPAPSAVSAPPREQWLGVRQ